MKRLSLFIIFCVCAVQLVASPASDLKVIKRRLQLSFATTNPSATEVDKIMGELNATGQFDGVDYANTKFNSGGDKRKHIQNITKLVKAYQNTSGPHFRKKEVYDAISKSFTYWVDTNIQDENWWHRVIGFPKDLMIPFLLIGDEMSRYDKELYKKCVDYMLYSWGEPKQRAQEGANGTDICKFTFTTAVITGDDKLLTEVIDKVNSLVKIVVEPKEEGIQADYSFSQHTGSGRQLYLATYGHEYIDGLLYFMEFINGTSFQFSAEKVDIIENLFLNGVAWAWYKNEMDASQCGRKIVDTNMGPSFVNLTKRLYALNTPRKNEIKTMLDVMGGKGQLLGNKMYWRHDYMLHRGNGYTATARMTSTRTVGNEAGNGQGFENYHTGDGANYIKVKGNEYSPIYATWNWKHIPGTTVIDDTKDMPQPMWGKGGEGTHEYASGASDGQSGVSAFIYEKDGLKAQKSWFFFDGYFVALGAGITSTRDDADAVTTINQTSLSGAVTTVDADGAAATMGATATNISKLWHNDVGYTFMIDSSYGAAVEKKDKSTILWINTNHGKSSSNKTYAYVVHPNISKDKFLAMTPTYTILANNQTMQAVADRATRKVMIAFYEAAEIETEEVGVISVDKPSLVIVETSGKVTVANPFCESRPQGSVTVKINDKSKTIEFKDSSVSETL